MEAVYSLNGAPCGHYFLFIVHSVVCDIYESSKSATEETKSKLSGYYNVFIEHLIY